MDITSGYEDLAKQIMSGVGSDPLNLANRSQIQVSARIATVDSAYSGTGRPALRFWGEASVGSRLYPYVDSYTPTASDDVIVLLFSHSGIILGKIV